MKHTPQPFFLPERCLFLSARRMKKSGGCNDSDNISQESHVSVKQRMLQSLMSLWKATLALISFTLLSRDWTLTSNMLGSGGWCARLRSLTRRPLSTSPTATVLCRPLGLDPISWVVVRKKDLLRESRILGCNVCKLTLLLYPIVLPGCM